ncbi:MAG: nuclear transport factor 2 family protein [Bacteroidota bacterium]|nr:nuclear transport factor 2 family protein [Bacteroidota bacterium]
MKKSTILFGCLALLILFSCETKKDDSSAMVKSETTSVDMSAVKADIQAIENEWAAAQNAKDITRLMALYADDAVSMPDGEPMLSGKAAIQAKQEKDFTAPAKYASIAFETLDVYGTADEVTEVGKTRYLDAAGKETGAGKYVAVFQKKDGKYKCVREIYNKDSK